MPRLDLLENYLRSGLQSAPEGTIIAGYGEPKIPVDMVYAANELRKMLELRDSIEAVPGVDLSNVVLYSQPWPGIDFSGVDYHSVKIDLRGANLRGSRWGSSFLAQSYLQCADLTGAVFGGTKRAGLAYVDLRGANLANARLHADLTGANLEGANLEGADFTGANLNAVNFNKTVNFDRAIGLEYTPHDSPDLETISHSFPDDVNACLKNPDYWSSPVE